MNRLTRWTLFSLFFLSGFAGLVYQVVWTRMAFASFGIIAPVLSVVISVFMLGLAVGSWAGGRAIGPLVRRTGLSAAVFYAAAELLIGCGAFAVPAAFALGGRLLLGSGQIDSAGYLARSALVLAIAILPWCLCMGVTFPFMLAHVRERDGAAPAHGFSFLYVANVLGAMTGTALTALVLIETLGFRHTLWVAAASNGLVAATAAALSLAARRPTESASTPAPAAAATAPDGGVTGGAFALSTLFTTGLVSMALEVVWTRGFAGVLKTQVYSFAMILFAYLAATLVGSVAYRRQARRGRVRPLASLLLWTALAALLPIFANDPRVTTQDLWASDIPPLSATAILASICPLCALLGYLTPSLIDRHSAGDPRRAGTAYAANVVGCIVGPLVACYGLMPTINGRLAQLLLVGPLFTLWLIASRGTRPGARATRAVMAAVALAAASLVPRDFEELTRAAWPNVQVRRDSIASVVAFGDSRMRRLLVVNGTCMTTLTPITKFIAHLPLALHRGPPKSALVVCFGMGTSYRSALSWGIDTTAVELVPSVPPTLGVFHPDAERVLADPHGRIVVDDGRRYLARCGKRFDIISVDPPPPVEAAGSSLLYSTEFYALAKAHLNPGGIVQMWSASKDPRTAEAVARSMCQSFPYVRRFGSIEGWGDHLLGSMSPITVPTADEAAARLPPAAAADLIEWRPSSTAAGYLGQVLRNERPVAELLGPDPSVVVTDDRPFNEYYLLRRSR